MKGRMSLAFCVIFYLPMEERKRKKKLHHVVVKLKMCSLYFFLGSRGGRGGQRRSPCCTLHKFSHDDSMHLLFPSLSQQDLLNFSSIKSSHLNRFAKKHEKLKRRKVCFDNLVWSCISTNVILVFLLLIFFFFLGWEGGLPVFLVIQQILLYLFHYIVMCCFVEMRCALCWRKIKRILFVCIPVN